MLISNNLSKQTISYHTPYSKGASQKMGRLSMPNPAALSAMPKGGIYMHTASNLQQPKGTDRKCHLPLGVSLIMLLELCTLRAVLEYLLHCECS